MGQQGGTSAQSFWDNLLPNYQTPYGDLANAYMKNLQGGLVNAPTFNEMYGSYRKVAETEANRQGAAITESMGSTGSRYGSSILNAQSQMRSNLTDKLRSASSDFMMGLRQQQAKEVGGAVAVDVGQRDIGTQRMFEDFLRRTSPPPLYGTAVQLSGGYGLPATYFN